MSRFLHTANCRRSQAIRTAFSTSETGVRNHRSSQPSGSFWMRELSRNLLDYQSSAHLPKYADTIIVGSGITAAGAAWHLQSTRKTTPGQRHEHPSLVMLEAQEVCSGASGRNGGHCFPIIHEYPHDPSIGNFELANLHAIEKMIHELDIDCDYHPQTSVRVFFGQDGVEEARNSIQILKMKDPSLAAYTRLTTNSEELGSLRIQSAKGATVSSMAGRLWVYKFVAAIVERLVFPSKNCVDQSMALYTSTSVKSIAQIDHSGPLGADDRSVWCVETSRGTIHARQVILATNGYTSSLLPSFAQLIEPCRGQAAAFEAPAELSGKSRLRSNYMFLGQDFDDYLVQCSDEAGAHLIFGGGHEARGLGITDDSVLDEDTSVYLTQRLYHHMDLERDATHSTPSLRPTHEWTGIMGFSRDGLPWVGPIPGMPGVFLAAGYTGNGMPNAFLSGRAVAVMARAYMEQCNDEAILQSAVEHEDVRLPLAYRITSDRIIKARRAVVTEDII